MANSISESMTYSMLVQINSNLLALLRILNKMNQDGIYVKTQESHRP